MQDAENEDVPDESILEHGQDESPQETERLKQLKEAKDEQAQLAIKKVKDVVRNAIEEQRHSGGTISNEVRNAEEAIESLGKGKLMVDSTAGITRSELTLQAEGQMAKQAVADYTKEKASQDFVESIEKAKAAGESTFHQIW